MEALGSLCAKGNNLVGPLPEQCAPLLRHMHAVLLPADVSTLHAQHSVHDMLYGGILSLGVRNKGHQTQAVQGRVGLEVSTAAGIEDSSFSAAGTGVKKCCICMILRA